MVATSAQIGTHARRSASRRDVLRCTSFSYVLLRAAELALRLKYAEVPETEIHLVPELPAALDAAVRRAAGKRLFVLPTYTAMLALREELSRRGHVSQYWARTA